MKNGLNEVLIGGAIIFKENKSKKFYLLSKNSEGDWEIPKTTVRRGESSVRSVIRYTTEQGNMNTRVLDEVGRLSVANTINNKVVTQKTIYYLLYFKAGAEIMGMGEINWFDYLNSVRKIKNKKELNLIKTANTMVKNWEKNKKKRTPNT